jgi:ubiquinone/menaquinone biosynthesis C-methylase UbiE
MSKNLYDYKYYLASKKFQGEGKRLEKFSDLIKSYNPTKVLDVGCGIGYLVKKLNKDGIETIGIDFSPDLEEFWGDDDDFFEMDAKQILFPDKAFDVVFSSDFFEHLDEDDVDGVATEMKRVGKKVITFVADDLGKPLNRHQSLYHLTHKPIDWWEDRLKGIDVHSSHLWK